MEKAAKGRIREVQALLREKKERDASGLFVAEGFKIVNDMTSRGHMPEYVLMCEGFADSPEKKEFIDRCGGKSIPLCSVSRKDFEKISALRSSQGILAVIPKAKRPSTAFLDAGRRLIVLCDGIQDPGNLGSILRTSAAFGADAVMFSGETVDMYNPKVVRASSGTILDTTAIEYSDEIMKELKNKGYKLLVSMVDAAGTQDVREMKSIPARTIAAFGSEGAGVSQKIAAAADGYFHIGTSKSVESLNVTAAVAVSLFVFSGLLAE